MSTFDPRTTLETISAWWQGSELRRESRQHLDICMNWARRLKRVFGPALDAARIDPKQRASILTCCCEVRREILLARCCEPTVDLFGTRLRFFNCRHARPLREAPELASDRIVVQEVHP
jgi:hypothetical protein